MSRLSSGRARSVSAENFSGAKCAGGAATEGTGTAAARELGRGWKVSPMVDFEEGEVPGHAGYLHAAWRRSNPLADRQVHTLLDGARGPGHYVGTYLAWGSNISGWWGRGRCFDTDIRVTVQALGWRSGGRYLPLHDDIASTVWWYAADPAGTEGSAPDHDLMEVN